MSSLVLGPLLRHVDTTSAVVWVEVDRRAVVSVTAGGRTWEAPTFAVHGHHFAVVDAVDLEPGAHLEYVVAVDGTTVWPPSSGEGSALPPSRLRTYDCSDGLRFSFGSCRKSAPHDEENDATFGVDALRTLAVDLAGGEAVTSPTASEQRPVAAWPDFLLLLGDQVYADETSQAMRDFIAARRDIDSGAGHELADFEEYAHLYSLAWSDPEIRWVLSTVSSLMIFDDHDVRDDWNTSQAWREEMEATSWWHGRIVAGLASYWVYQHLGNMTPAERAEDGVWQQVLARREQGLDDVSDLLDDLGARADAEPDSYRWSYHRELGGTRLVVVDSRAARVLRDGRRQILDDAEMTWLDERLTGDVDHLLVATSVPFLLPMGLHETEACNEAIAEGAWGARSARGAEKVRQGIDLEHWAAFQASFRTVAQMVDEVADGLRGSAPATVTFLSGDVHHSYLMEVDRVAAGGGLVLQAVCSPVRNRLSRGLRLGQTMTGKAPAVAVARMLSRRAGVAPPPFTWTMTRGPWFENMIATLRVDGRRLRIGWQEAVDVDGGPRLRDAEGFDNEAVAPVAELSRG